LSRYGIQGDRLLKTVFILGAGASKKAGSPLMSDFLDRASDLSRFGGISALSKIGQDIEEVFKAISELQSVYYKSHLDLDNIESVFGAIEMALILKKLGKRSYEEIQKLRDSLVTVIYKTLEYGIKFPVIGQTIYSPEPYEDFASTLIDALKNNRGTANMPYSFITFNYDLCLDHALRHFNGCDYCLNGKRDAGKYPLLKLHGSINWGLSGEEIIPRYIQEAHFDLWGDNKYVYYDLGSKLSNKTHNDKPLSGPPVIIPPTWDKNSYHAQISNVWSVAASELSTAENIIVIGYSLPETDSFFRYLFALGADSPIKIRNFVVINPDESGQVEKGFRALTGQGIENRLKFIKKPFEESLNEISDILNNK
jgi:hypothetical protein